ncbi:unnamed protein product [Rotaria sp. Silwood1]|nr:unnamed protein product [Rotaria sp. Silwood1]CAF3458012.1 unnamed protein product [Rotaria sp. Silwood1]CAF4520974.1 unnamed protein product [Rotaria sp. Silwood1]
MFYWVYLLFLFLSSPSTKTLKYDFQNQSFRAPIVTLTHGDPLRDGNIHAVILVLASDTKCSQKIQFAYAHNIHIYGKRNKNFDLQHN